MKVVTMGEVMLRLITPGFLRVEQADRFDAIYDGDEAIVGASLSRFGENVAYVTKLPKNALGEACYRRLLAQGIDGSHIAWGGGRLGVNFYETGVAMRPPRVTYDRAGSAFACAELEDFDFDAIFANAGWFHFAGITPALSPQTRSLTRAAVAAAKRHGVTVSCDLNYRRKLWSIQEAQSFMKEIMKDVDVCIGNEEDAECCLGLKPEEADISKGKLPVEAYKAVFEKIRRQYGCRYVGCTLRESYSASDNGWSVLCYDGEAFFQSRHYDIRLVDRGGGGASFAAGFIYGLLHRLPLQAIAEFAGAASALKHTIYGGFNLVTLEEVYELAGGDASGRVQR
ncbi:MAG: sugar kinase [Clostridia bacterium]|nr:sugar kinase [Clostridia bacterium]